MKYDVEVVWNREFHWSFWKGGFDDIDAAVQCAKAAENMGDGARVKKARVLDSEGRTRWQYGRLVEVPQTA